MGIMKHGMSDSEEFQIWVHMKQRCYNSNRNSYEHYGGKGIAVCDRWLNSFENFYADMGPRPSPDHSLERKEINGDYCPDNCRWATDTEQANNKSNTTFVTHNGVTKPICDWARETESIKPNTIRRRLARGWSTEDALTKPNGAIVKMPGNVETQFQPKLIEYDGKKQSIKAWAKELGFANPSPLEARLRKGLPLETALTPPWRKHKR